MVLEHDPATQSACSLILSEIFQSMNCQLPLKVLQLSRELTTIISDDLMFTQCLLFKLSRAVSGADCMISF